MLVIGNKCDLAEKREVQEAEGKALAEQSHAQFFETR